MAEEPRTDGELPASAEEEADPRIGRVLQGRYRIHERIAAGGMGAVYKGERLGLGRPVAIKFLHAALARDPQVMKRFEVEAQAMSRLAHPNCIAVTDFGVDELPYLVMDYVQGSPLRTIIDEQGGLPARRAIKIANQLLAALGHAHALGIIHRDMKPENVVLDTTPGLADHARILDFGLAKLLGSDSGLTVGMAVGTPNYMAPEQTREGPVDGRADLYAVGIVLFEMLTGDKPFDSTDMGEVFLRQIAMPPPKLRTYRPKAGFSAALEAVVLRAMAKAPQDRFATASEMIAALEAVPEASAVTAGPVVVGAGDKRPAAAAGPPPGLPGSLPDATVLEVPAHVVDQSAAEGGSGAVPTATATPGLPGRVRSWVDGHPLRVAGIAAAGSALLVLLIAALWSVRSPSATQASPAAGKATTGAASGSRASSSTAAASSTAAKARPAARAPAMKKTSAARAKPPVTRPRTRAPQRSKPPAPVPARKRPFLELL